ncbi:uncharacterized protein LOC115663435 [Syzygium oleosum]|uniref:uncharacterized protein LOC115663435 n=1 Tax=Syzygium oleosum TaxID=219896 RepID=UPI0011D2ACB0|nr:uncharacterized protein LOC115663435 [Syzygium oleosum]
MRSNSLCRATFGAPFLRPTTTTRASACSSPCSNPIRLHHHQKPIFLQTLNLSRFAAARAEFARMSSQGSYAEAQKLISFSLSPTSALVIQKGDITKWSVDGSSDAIVNPANERMLGGGGADGAIHRAAGPELLEACYKVPEVRPGIRCPTGEARITAGFRLPASHVIHTVGPIYDADSNPQASLRNAYRNSLMVAKEKKLQHVAFPAISCGVYGYPYDEAATIAISTLKESSDGLKEVHFVLFSDDIYNAWLSKAKELLQQ